MTDRLEAQLKDVFYKLDLKPANINLFLEYIDILNRWNRNINLISKKENDIVGNLIAPSLLFFKLVKNCNKKRLVDLGSGAGFPAIVIKIYNPSIDVILIEKNRKKAVFLNYVCAKLNLSCNIFEKDISNIDEKSMNFADIVTVRGIAITEKLVEIIKRKTRGRQLMYFTSPKLYLSLALIAKAEFNSISAQLYEL